MSFERTSGAKPQIDLVEPYEKTSAEEMEAMFGDLRYYGWMAEGIISVLSFTFYSQKFHKIDTMRKTGSPAAWHTFYGLGEYLRVTVNMIVSLFTGLLWVGTFIPVRMTHKAFGDSTSTALAIHGLKYFGLIMTKIGAYFSDDFTRDYENGVENG
jgi:hypothetical protein